MKYIKKLALYTKSPMNDRLSVLDDNRIVTTSKTTMQLPAGVKTDRPSTDLLTTGTIRYNYSLREFEVYNPEPYNTGASNTKWEIIRTVRQATITRQTLGYGTYEDTIFGPLAYNVDVNKPQNVFVFVENVYQLPVTDYTLIQDPASSTSTVALTTSSGVTTLYLNTLTNVDVGIDGHWRTISAPSGIQVGTTVTNVSNVWNNIFYGYPIEISLPTTGSIGQGTIVSFDYQAGVYIQFTPGGLGAPFMKPVTALLGFDGYFPAGPYGTSWEVDGNTP
jgi:hypothetical protein